MKHIAPPVWPMPTISYHALCIDHQVPAVDEPHFLACPIEHSQLTLDLDRRPEIVGIDECDQVGSRRSPTRIAGGGHTGVCLLDQPHARVDFRVTSGDRGSLVA